MYIYFLYGIRIRYKIIVSEDHIYCNIDNKTRTLEYQCKLKVINDKNEKLGENTITHKIMQEIVV